MLDAASVRKTVDGFLVATPRVARIGIQDYFGTEIGRPDLAKVRVYRPEAEVFHKDAMTSLAHRPISQNHPQEMITASNWRDHAVGQVGEEVARDGDYIRVPIMLMDGDVINDVDAGTRELSLGYTCDFDFTPGKIPGTDDAYDAVQRNIRVNHLAVVGTARGGNKLRIGDSNMKTIVLDGFNVEVSEIAETVIKRVIDALTGRATKAEGDLATKATELANANALVATKDLQIADLNKKVADATAPAALDAAVKDRASVIEKGKDILGDALVSDGKTNAEIRRQVVDAKLGDAAKGWSDEQVATSFVTLAALPAQDSSNPLATALSSAQPSANASGGAKAYDAMCNQLENAWKGPEHKAA